MFFQIKKRCEGEPKSEYATHSDFCTIFVEQMQRLYLLALLLTGDQASAEQCFVAAFELAAEKGGVFKDSATSWSRRSVIRNAIRITSPSPRTESRPHLVGNHRELKIRSGASLEGVQALPPFDRFVFVMSLLEGYSDRECSVLLSCAMTDILSGRISAVQQLAMTDEKDCRGRRTRDYSHAVDADWLECG
jgi:DNA-directed RNA polymerase specialized sigma24 family protein